MINKNNVSEVENNKNSDSSLIINEAINNKIEIDNNNITDTEGLPILSQPELVKTSFEDFYRTKYPEFKIIRFYGFYFIKMGNLLTFNFDKNNFIPKNSIGPHWYLTLILVLLIFGLSFFLYSTIFKPLSSYLNFLFFVFILIEYFFVFKTALTHAKVVMNKKRTSEEIGFCTICKVYFNPNNKVEHCRFCGVCVEKMDHHCVWVGKCVAKNNTFYFYAMIVNICILYIYIIICGVFMAFKEK